MDKNKIFILQPENKHAKLIYQLVKESKVLDVNSEYLYLLQTTHFKKSCAIAVLNKEVVGFASGYLLPENPNILFIWQVAVSEKLRGQDLAKKMILSILKREENRKINYIRTTVSPSNNSSLRVFEKIARKLSSNLKSKLFFEKSDFINQHEDEVLYEIGPFKIKEKKWEFLKILNQK